MQGEQALPRGWMRLPDCCRLAGARAVVREDMGQGFGALREGRQCRRARGGALVKPAL